MDPNEPNIDPTDPLGDESLGDDQLNALLRGVEVPMDLKASLRSIPNSTLDADSAKLKRTTTPTSIAKTNDNHSGFNLSALLVLAATLFAVGAFIAWPWITNGGNDTPIIVKTDSNSNTDTNDSNTLNLAPNKDDQNDTGQETQTIPPKSSIAQQKEELEVRLHQIEMQRLRARLASIKQDTPTVTMEAMEYDSLITAIADQTILQLGGLEETVRRDMVRVITRYPNTKGAEIAQQFIDERSN